jgi:hypothetical protein
MLVLVNYSVNEVTNNFSTLKTVEIDSIEALVQRYKISLPQIQELLIV